MNEEMQQRISGYLDSIEASASKAGDFVAKQTPSLAQECLAWEFWSSVMSCFLAFAICLSITVLSCKVFGRIIYAKDFDPSDHPELVFVFVPIILVVLSGGFAAIEGMHAVKVKVAPRVVLIDKMVELSSRSK